MSTDIIRSDTLTDFDVGLRSWSRRHKKSNYARSV